LRASARECLIRGRARCEGRLTAPLSHGAAMPSAPHSNQSATPVSRMGLRPQPHRNLMVRVGIPITAPLTVGELGVPAYQMPGCAWGRTRADPPHVFATRGGLEFATGTGPAGRLARPRFPPATKPAQDCQDTPSSTRDRVARPVKASARCATVGCPSHAARAGYVTATPVGMCIIIAHDTQTVATGNHKVPGAKMQPEEAAVLLRNGRSIPGFRRRTSS
jgi:hypothetical protein